MSRDTSKPRVFARQTQQHGNVGRRKMKVMPTIGFTLFISLFFVVGFGILGYGIRSLVLSNKAKTWPTTKGHIETCMVTESSDSEGGPTYKVDVRYNYMVAGQ